MQEVLRRILEAVFEPVFYDEMMGFRFDRGGIKQSKKLNTMIERKYTNHILDADIKGFFNHLDHKWMMKFVESKIKDPNILRLTRRMLKAGVVENYIFEEAYKTWYQPKICTVNCIQWGKNCLRVSKGNYEYRCYKGKTNPIRISLHVRLLRRKTKFNVKLIEPPCTERYARWCER